MPEAALISLAWSCASVIGGVSPLGMRTVSLALLPNGIGYWELPQPSAACEVHSSGNTLVFQPWAFMIVLPLVVLYDQVFLTPLLLLFFGYVGIAEYVGTA